MNALKTLPRARNRLATATLVRWPDLTVTGYEQAPIPSGSSLQDQYELDCTNLTGSRLELQQHILQSEPDILVHAGEGDVLVVFAKCYSPTSEVYREESDRFRQQPLATLSRAPEPSYHERFLERFRRDARAALAKLRFDATCIRNPESVTDLRSTREITNEEIAEILFPLLLDAPLSLQPVIQKMLVDLVDPKQVFAIASKEYELKGYEGYLLAASALFEKYGKQAWPILESLVSTGRPECEYFVFAVACLNDVAPDKRVRALTTLARSTDLDTRLRVVEALEYADAKLASPVWRVLSDDPDHEIRQCAAEHLED